MKALLVRLSAVGDVVHTLPTLAAMGRQGWNVGWVVEPPGRALLADHPLVTPLVPAPAARSFGAQAARAALRTLRREHFDVAFDLQGLWKSALWTRLSGARRQVGFARSGRREPASALLVRERVPLDPKVTHVIDKNLSLLRAVGLDAVGLREFPLPASGDRAAHVETRLAQLGLSEFVILNPGGGWTSKLWPAEHYATLARSLRSEGLASLVTWGPGEEALAEHIVTASGGAAVRCFATTLLEYGALAQRARLVVGADTGPLHLACAVGTPVVGLYGPTDPARNGPFSPRDVTLRRVPPCAPCHRRSCQRHVGVMDAISPAEVLAAVQQRLRSASPAPVAF